MPKVIGKYLRLRNLLKQQDIDQEYLAELLGRSGPYISRCLSGKSQWHINEIWAIVRLCRIELTEIYIYFPPDGVDFEIDVSSNPADKFAVELANLLQNYIREAVKA